ncbi:2735_t:CDS:2 [Funneliformis geosporum]|nr:2735_t:CDS:2 [Funneliformis geosporum]
MNGLGPEKDQQTRTVSLTSINSTPELEEPTLQRTLEIGIGTTKICQDNCQCHPDADQILLKLETDLKVGAGSLKKI